MSGVLDALASQIGASVEATIFLLSLFIGKANLCLCQNRCPEINRISYVIIHLCSVTMFMYFLEVEIRSGVQSTKFLIFILLYEHCSNPHEFI